MRCIPWLQGRLPGRYIAISLQGVQPKKPEEEELQPSVKGLCNRITSGSLSSPAIVATLLTNMSAPKTISLYVCLIVSMFQFRILVKWSWLAQRH